jgi:hypothetical protein
MKDRSVIHRPLAGWRALAAAVALAAAAGPAPAAISLFIDPTPKTVGPGDSSTVTLMVSGLGDNDAPALGAWSVEISYDDSVVSIDSITFGTGLDAGLLGSLPVDLSIAGLMILSDISLEFPDDLTASQADTFVLATIGFTAIGAAGSETPLTFELAELSDELANTLDGTATDGLIRIRDDGTTVPETLGMFPAALAMGLLMAAGSRRLRKGRS